MKIQIIKIDTEEDNFSSTFKPYEADFLKISSVSYTSYYGDSYQLKRIIDGRSTLYLALADDVLVGVSYIKKNLRRGGTAIYPENFRGLGIAERLVRRSLVDFKRQYTILSIQNRPMLSLMEKIGFRRASSTDEVRNIVKEEFEQLSDFEQNSEYLVFKRGSVRRQFERKDLTLLHTFYEL